jgi:hypothetical protein
MESHCTDDISSAGSVQVVQSRLKIEPHLIWEKLKPCMSHSLAEISRDSRISGSDADSNDNDHE